MSEPMKLREFCTPYGTVPLNNLTACLLDCDVHIILRECSAYLAVGFNAALYTVNYRGDTLKVRKLERMYDCCGQRNSLQSSHISVPTMSPSDHNQVLLCVM